MSLTEEEKKKIEEEESYRLSLHKHHESSKKRSGFGCFKIIGLIIVLFFCFSFLMYYLSSPKNSSNNPIVSNISDERNTDLIGKVNFDGTQFHIVNQDTKDWKNCWFRLNQDYYFPSNAPSQKFEIIKSGETLDLGGGEFTLKDGTRFNPFQIKPKEIAATCNEKGFGFWTW